MRLRSVGLQRRLLFKTPTRPLHFVPCSGTQGQANTSKVRIERLLSNLGYGKRREVADMVQDQRVTDVAGNLVQVGDRVAHSDILVDGQPLDPPSPLTVVINKPVDYVCTSPDDEKQVLIVYDLLPERFGRRSPELKYTCKLDPGQSGLLLLTDDAALATKVETPKKGIFKVYDVILEEEPSEDAFQAAAAQLASGRMRLDSSDSRPLLPVRLERTGPFSVRLATCEHRTNQVTRTLAAFGWTPASIVRTRLGGLELGELQPGQWRALDPEDLELLLGPTGDIDPITLQDVMKQKQREKAVRQDRRQRQQDAEAVAGRQRQPRRPRRLIDRGSSYDRMEADIEAALQEE